MSIFTTGAHLVPRQLANGRWAWVVAAFDGDTHADGQAFETPDAQIGQEAYYVHAERWGKEFDITPYAPCVAAYRFENGRLVITVQGDPNKAIEIVAEALEQDGYPVVGKSPVAKISAIRDAEATMMFTVDMVDLPIGQVYDSTGRTFKAAPLCRQAVDAQTDRAVEYQRLTVGVDPEVMKRWPEWAAAIALRIADETLPGDDRATLIDVLTKCFEPVPHVAARLIGTSVIEGDYLG